MRTFRTKKEAESFVDKFMGSKPPRDGIYCPLSGNVCKRNCICFDNIHISESYDEEIDETCYFVSGREVCLYPTFPPK